MPFAAAGGRVALSGTPVDDKPCIAMAFTLRPGRHPVQVLLASAAVRNPPPPGLITIVTLRGGAPDQVRVISVLESHAALANALARAPASALKKLGEVVIPGADIWIGPVGCIPHSVVPRAAVVRALVDGADSITVPPRRADGDAPHLADAVFGHDSRPQMEALFAKRYYRKRRVDWYATEPFSTVTSCVAHAFEVEPVRFEMAPGAGAPPRHQGDRGYGARQYTYQHRPHDPPVERPAPSTSAAELQGAGSVLRLRSEVEGVRAAAAVLRNQQAFVELGWRAPKDAEDDAGEGDTGGTSSADGDPDVALAPASSGASSRLLHVPRKPQPQCAKVLCAGQKQLQCYVDQRLVLEAEPGDIVVVNTPASPSPVSNAAAANGGDAPSMPEKLARVVALSRWSRSKDEPSSSPVVIGRVVSAARWSRGKAGPSQPSPSVVRRATIADVVDAPVTECAETPEIAYLREQLGGTLLRLFRTRLHRGAPSMLTLAEVHYEAFTAAGHTLDTLRTAVAATTGAQVRHVFRVVAASAGRP